MRSVSLAETPWGSGYKGIERDDYGCVTLWRAVVEVVVHDFISYSKYRKSRCKSNVYQKQEAADLIFGHNKSHFDDLCNLACIDPDYVRRKIKEDLGYK